jgi:hypothetical protein
MVVEIQASAGGAPNFENCSFSYFSGKKNHLKLMGHAVWLVDRQNQFFGHFSATHETL